MQDPAKSQKFTSPSRLREPVNFRDWAAHLEREAMSSGERVRYKQAIIGYLHWCGKQRTPASAASAAAFLDSKNADDHAREPLRWFIRAAWANGLPASAEPRQRVPGGPARLAPNAAADLGATGWERKLVATIRGRHLLWRTEQTYRMWAWRFVESLGGRSPESADEDDVRRFLDRMAVEQRVAPATQRQALNAVVFLLCEALGREVGDFGDYRRARPRASVPVVLAKEVA